MSKIDHYRPAYPENRIRNEVSPINRKEQEVDATGLNSSQKIAAISWEAKNAGISYGNFVYTLSDADREAIYYRYAKLLNDRREAEMERLGKTKINKPAKSPQQDDIK